MQKTVILILGVLILFVFTTSLSAKVQIIDVIYLTDGSVVTGKIIEKIPHESIKIETKEKSWTKDQSISIIEMSEVDKIKTIQFIEPKSPGFATSLGCGAVYLNAVFASPIPIFSVGQVYNGEYIKALAFFGVGVCGIWTYDLGKRIAKPQDDYHYLMDVGATALFGSAILSVFDAYYSAKRINSEAKKKVLSTTTSLNYIPHEGMMASYSFGF